MLIWGSEINKNLLQNASKGWSHEIYTPAIVAGMWTTTVFALIVLVQTEYKWMSVTLWEVTGGEGRQPFVGGGFRVVMIAVFSLLLK